ncbi:hypothetical protein [Psychrobacter aquaticus]|uniref:Uncharacterized protein n=1 Tax=Psychrobacter aquaticus CMS 56 TaxID=1354303 RepID=U4T5S2_9GAMM|nr:hypothetical protein [Psychrobacter aquaticus]ERL56260.1 hypothetical protein M917_0938 [Psychrobacter aquaticus CMS 56]
MIPTSTIAMYIMMYFDTHQWDHVYFSETRAYMGAGLTFIVRLRN